MKINTWLHLNSSWSILIVIGLLWSCDSISVSNVKTTKQHSIYQDSLQKNGFFEFQSYFVHLDSSSTEDKQRIPFEVAIRFLGNELDSVNGVYEILPVAYFKNNNGHFFIVQLDCGAGGDCAFFYLLSFNSNLGFNNKKLIGREVGELSTSTFFEYYRGADSLLVVNEILYDNNNDTYIDTIMTKILLK